MKKVVIIYKHIPQYRKDFFLLLREYLRVEDVNLELIYGQASGFDSSKNDSVKLDWAVPIKNRYLKFMGKDLVWQPCFSLLKSADLIIVEQAGKLLLNYPLILASKLGVKKVAYWGHGRNFQAHTENKLNGWLKSKLVTQVDWWFCYNDFGSKDILESGFPREQVTIVNNAINTKRIAKGVASITKEQVEGVKKRLGVSSSNIAIYVGGMYAEKRLSFLIKACELIREKVEDFEIIFIGNGVDAYVVKNAAQKYSWVHYEGPKFFDEVDVYFAISKMQLMPGLVGLGVLDSFASETPMITTAVPYHSPEIDYLVHGRNGMIINDTDDVNIYASEVSKLFKNKDKLEQLIDGCRESKGLYTVELMAERFSRGVCKAITVGTRD